MNFVARNLNLAIKQSRKFSSSFLPVTPPPLVTSPQKGSEYKFFGIRIIGSTCDRLLENKNLYTTIITINIY